MSSYCTIPEFYSYTEPVARKRHACCECSAPILPGEKYFRAAGSWEGEFGTHCQHLLCMEAAMFIRDHFNDGECIGFGTLQESFSEMRGGRAQDRTRAANDPKLRRLRSLMARILWREHNERVRAGAG